MTEKKPFALELEDGRTIHGRLDLPDVGGRRPAVLICHGFKGFLEWGFFPPLAHLLTDRGFVTARFNFSGSGMRPGDERVTDEAAFRGATFSRDVAEVRRLLRALAHELAPDRVDPERLGLFGHSRGGGASILAAAESRDDEPRVGALVTWAAVSTFDRLPTAEKKRWRRQGEIEIANARTGQVLTMGSEVLDDLERRGHELDIPAAAASRRAPWLIVHGEQDETVPVTEAETLRKAAAEPCEMLRIRRGGHTFGAVHPFAGPTPQLVEAMNATQAWFRRHLGE